MPTTNAKGDFKKILVCGAGSIGVRHIKNCLNLNCQVGVWRERSELLDQLEWPQSQCRRFLTLEDGISWADAVVVATATDRHEEIFDKAFIAGKHTYIEKPVSHNLNFLKKGIPSQQNIAIEMGYQFRGHPGLKILKECVGNKDYGNTLSYHFSMGYRIDSWRMNSDYRDSYSSDVARGGGPIYDLIHQIDLALWIFSDIEEVSAVCSKVSPFSIIGDDVCNLVLSHVSGLAGSIQLDMVSPVNRCYLEIVCEHALIKWNHENGHVYIVDDSGSRKIYDHPKTFDRNDLFLTLLKNWILRMDKPEIDPMCSLQEGIESLRVAILCHESNVSKKTLKN